MQDFCMFLIRFAEITINFEKGNAQGKAHEYHYRFNIIFRVNAVVQSFL